MKTCPGHFNASRLLIFDPHCLRGTRGTQPAEHSPVVRPADLLCLQEDASQSQMHCPCPPLPHRSLLGRHPLREALPDTPERPFLPLAWLFAPQHPHNWAHHMDPIYLVLVGLPALDSRLHEDGRMFTAMCAVLCNSV